jgi:murein DD-endopeptidase MepM/ murein hydrolase activator NlpD
MTLMRLMSALGIGLLAGCSGGPTSPSPAATACNPTASSARIAMAIFSKPFTGDFPTGTLFDHDKPLLSDDRNGYALSMCGVQLPDQENVNGHDGYDWRMPEGTPVRAAAGGLVMFAGTQAPSDCPPLGRSVQAIYVQLRHQAPDGTEFITLYGHLARVAVAQGDVIEAGTVVGASGNTGCSGTPHLHFGTFKGHNGTFTVIDPYGWHATAADPWEIDPRGTASIWLWRDGEAPRLR